MGYNVGTLTQWAGFALNTDAFSNMNKYAALEPMLIYHNAGAIADAVEKLINTNVLEVGGPTFHMLVENMVQAYGRVTTVAVTGLLGAMTTIKGVSVKTYAHFMNNFYADSFQNWSDDDWDSSKWSEVHDLLDFSSDKTIPVGLFVSE